MNQRKYISLIITLTLFTFFSCRKVDITVPFIKLIGPSVIYHELNEKYVDPGVIVTDDTDKEIEAVADIGVNENKTGPYKVIWTAVDAAGNSAQISRDVIVFNIADSLNGYYDGNCTKPYPPGNIFNIENEHVFADSLENNKIWFSGFASYDSCFVYLKITDSLCIIPEQTVKLILDSSIEISFKGSCIIENNSFDIDFTESGINDTIICKTVLFKQ